MVLISHRKWNFQLGSKIGVSSGPVDVSINPSGSYERDRTVGTMMKIQGTTRSISPKDLPSNAVTAHNPPNRHDLRDRKIVWSLEENDQQEGGLPREFTFVFLIEQPRVAGGKINGDVVVGDIRSVFKDITIGIKVKPSVTGFGVDSFENEFQYTTVIGEIGQRFYAADEWQDQQSQEEKPLPQIIESPAALRDNATAAMKKSSAFVKKLTNSGSATGSATNATSAKPLNTSSMAQPKATTTVVTTAATPAPSTEIETVVIDSVDGAASEALVSIFKPNRSSVAALPDTKTGKSTGPPDASNIPEQEKFKNNRTGTLLSEKSLGPDPSLELRLFNFALMEGSFEDLIELPGNSVTSLQPTLPEPK